MLGYFIFSWSIFACLLHHLEVINDSLCITYETLYSLLYVTSDGDSLHSFSASSSPRNCTQPGMDVNLCFFAQLKDCYFLILGKNECKREGFEFLAPTTSRNVMRVLRAMQLSKPGLCLSYIVKTVLLASFFINSYLIELMT